MAFLLRRPCQKYIPRNEETAHKRKLTDSQQNGPIFLKNVSVVKGRESLRSCSGNDPGLDPGPGKKIALKDIIEPINEI